MTKTSIEWAMNPDGTRGEVWNPVTGCNKVSQGCKNCYAAELHDRRHRAYLQGAKLPAQYAKPFNQIQLHEDRLEMPLHWKKPRRIFVNSTSDLFHEDVSIGYIARVFDVMASWPLRCRDKACSHDDPECWQEQNHIYMILTKRADRMQKIIGEELPWYVGENMPGDSALSQALEYSGWPLPNVWLGVSAENQKAADERIPLLLQTPAAVRFVSCEPLLGPVDLTHVHDVSNHLIYDVMFGHWFDYDLDGHGVAEPSRNKLDWVIVGGESGPNARPFHLEWARSIRDQCVSANVPYFFKQWGEWYPSPFHGSKSNHGGGPYDPATGTIRLGKKAAGRLLDGREWNQYPEDGK